MNLKMCGYIDCTDAQPNGNSMQIVPPPPSSLAGQLVTHIELHIRPRHSRIDSAVLSHIPKALKLLINLALAELNLRQAG
jgi:hypothetical protein